MMAEAKQDDAAELGAADVCGGRASGEAEKILWPKFGRPLVDPAGGGRPVGEEHLTWLQDLD
jgi:hypothetical protein